MTQFGLPFSVVMVDLDGFKSINDTWGHPAGDTALKHVARLLKVRLRQLDVIARLGGEEFAIVLPGAREADAVRLAEKLRAQLEASPLDLDGNVVNVTASFGVAEVIRDGDGSVNDGLRRADMALYAAKRGGRNRVVAYSATLAEPT